MFPGRFAAKKLYGWDDKKYDREYWNRMERNWRKWKGMKPLRQRKLEMIKEEGEYQEEKIKEWNEKDKMGRMGDPYEEL